MLKLCSRIAVGAALALVFSPAALAQKISQYPNTPGNNASPGDAVMTQSTACTGGNCRTTVGQILGTLGLGTVTTPQPTDYLVMTPSGATPRLASISSILSLLGTGNLLAQNNLSDLSNPTLARTNLGVGSMGTQNHTGVNILGGTISGVQLSGQPRTSSFSTTLGTALTSDMGGLTVQLSGSATANSMYQASIGGCTTCFNADVIRGVATATPGSTVINTNAIAGYIMNSNPAVTNGQNSVGLYMTGVSAVNNAETWGINTNLSDNTTLATSNGTGRKLLNEFDFNVTSTSTQINGLVLQGASLAQPASANGFVVSPLNIGQFNITWNNAFYAFDGASLAAMYVGTSGAPTTSNANSQPIEFAYTNSSAAKATVKIYATPAGFATNATAILPAVTNTTNVGSSTLAMKTVYANAVQLTPLTVSTLPTCNTAANGAQAYVTDAATPTWHATLTGGGTGTGARVTALCNGTAWVAD